MAVETDLLPFLADNTRTDCSQPLTPGDPDPRHCHRLVGIGPGGGGGGGGYNRTCPPLTCHLGLDPL